MAFNFKRFADSTSANLIFTCLKCEKACSSKYARNVCANCSGTLFKVARLSTIDQPIMEDPDSQIDPYRQEKNNPDRGTQFNNFGGEGTQTQTIGGPNDRPEFNARDTNVDGRPLPSDGGAGDTFPNDSYVSQVADGSPLKQPTKTQDLSPFNFMRSVNSLQADDPYELIRKRKFK